MAFFDLASSGPAEEELEDLGRCSSLGSTFSDRGLRFDTSRGNGRVVGERGDESVLSELLAVLLRVDLVVEGLRAGVFGGLR